MWWLLVAAQAADVANPFEEPDESDLYRLDEQLVTVASRYAQTVRKAPSIVSLITAEQIRERGYRTVSEVLRDLPGIYVWKSNEGRDLAVFRGVVAPDNNKVLLLVDGVPWYDGVYTHTFTGDYLPLSHVAQIEVIKGPGSAIYGTNAFAGVVNIVTRSGSDIDGGTVRVVAGGTGRTDVTGQLGARSRVGSLDVDATAYVRVLDQLGDGLDRVPRDRADINGYDPKRGINVGGRLTIEGLQLAIHHVDYTHTFLVSEVDAPFAALGKDIDSFALFYHNTYIDGRYAIRASEWVTITPNLWWQRHDNPGSYFFLLGYDTQETAPGEFETELGSITVETEKDTRRWGTGVDVETQPGVDHVLVGGLGIENVEVLVLEDREFFGETHEFAPPTFKAPRGSALRNVFAFSQYTWTASPSLELTAGARLDKRIPSNAGEKASDDAFDLFASPRAGVLLVPTERVTAKLLYGHAFRSASVRELLVRAQPEEDGTFEYASGNLSLTAEAIDTVETEVTADVSEGVQVRTGASYSVVSNEIDKVSPPNQYRNLAGGLGIAGAEAEVNLSAGIVRFRTAYALTLANYADERRNPYRGRQQYEFPPHMVKSNLGFHVTDALSTTVTSEVYSSRERRSWSPDAKLKDGKAVALLHLGARVADLGPNDAFELGLSIRNLFDADWGTAVYRDDANALNSDGTTRFPREFEAIGRAVNLALEADF